MGADRGRQVVRIVSRCPPYSVLAVLALVVALGFVLHTYRLGRLHGQAARAMAGAAGDAAFRPPPGEAAGCSVRGMRAGEARTRAPLLPVRRFVVSLDRPPHERWREVAREFAPRLSGEVESYLESVIAEVALGQGVRPGELRERVRQSLARHRRHRTVPPSRVARPGGGSGAAGRVLPGTFEGGLFYDRAELEAFAREAGVGAEDLALLQLAYEAAARCTSVVASTAGGTIVHGRTLDWDAPFLRAMTIEVEFRRGGETVHVASTWAGYLGVLTGLRPNGFSVSVNWRRSAVGLLENFHHLGSGVWAAGCLVRHVLEADAAFPRYADAVRALASFPLAAPAYIVVAGTGPSEGVVLTRGRRASLNPLRLMRPGYRPAAAGSVEDGPLFGSDRGQAADAGAAAAAAAAAPAADVQELALALVQTNTDHWVDAAAAGDTRRTFVSSYLENEERDYRLNRVGDLWSLLTAPPVFDESTLYVTVMSASSCLMETQRRQS